MSGSEEKSEAASDKKLRDQREKGQVPKAPDLTAAITTGAVIGFVLIGGGGIAEHELGLLDAAGRAATLPFPEATEGMTRALRGALVADGMVPLLIAVAAAVLAGLLVNKGVVFSLDPLKPRFGKLNPIAGLKNMVKANAFIELAKSVVKAILFGVTLLLVARAALGPLLNVPACSPGCVPGVLRAMLVPLLCAAALFYLLSGLADLMIQRWNFMRENRMTKKEVKDERKETMGNPVVRQQQRRLRQEQRNAPKLGLARATVLVRGDGVLVGLRYRPGETPVPMVVCRGTGDAAGRLAQEGRTRAIPTFQDAPLAAGLLRKVQLGQVVTAEFFNPVARAIHFAKP